MKKVRYLNEDYNVDDNMMYMATNKNGMLYAYTQEPIWCETRGQWVRKTGSMQYLGICEPTKLLKI